MSTRSQLQTLLRMIEATRQHEIDCDEFLHRAAPLLESIAAEQGLPDTLLPVAQHLTVCPECREEFDALLRTHGIRS